MSLVFDSICWRGNFSKSGINIFGVGYYIKASIFEILLTRLLSSGGCEDIENFEQESLENRSD